MVVLQGLAALLIASLYTLKSHAERVSLAKAVHGDGVTLLPNLAAKPEDLRFNPPIHNPRNPTKLQEQLHLLDVILLASVDGRFHAVRRTNGEVLWSTPNNQPFGDILHPLVQTNHNLDREDDDDDEAHELYIVEPQTGEIYVLPDNANESEPLRRLPYSIPQLVELSPFSLSDPARTFVGKKETSIVTLDLETGSILGTTNHLLENRITTIPDDGEAHGGYFDEDEEVENARRPRVEIQIGRTDYRINVMSKNSVVQSLAFTVYGPNNIDRDKQMLWDHTPDGVYVQPLWDGNAYAFETKSQSETNVWIARVPEPVVAVFDVVTPIGSTDPVILLQPRPRLQELFPTRYSQLEDIPDRTVVGQVGKSLFAMGNVNFPLVNIAQLPSILSSSGGITDGEGKAVVKRCRELRCFVGTRFTERKDAQSRLTRLLGGPDLHKLEIHRRSLDSEDSDGAADQPLSSDPGPTSYPSGPPIAEPNMTIPPERRLPAPSERQIQESDPIILQPLFDDNKGWTLLLSLAGGIIAVWLLLQRYMKIGDHGAGTGLERSSIDLIQPLQREGSSRENLDELPVSPPAYSASTAAEAIPLTPREEPRQPIASSSRTKLEDLRDLSEKASLEDGLAESSQSPDSGPSGSYQPPSSMPAAVEDGGDDSEKDDEDGGGKKKGRRRKRGKKNKATPTTPNGNADHPLNIDDYVEVQRPPITSEPSPIVGMTLPLPVQQSASSLVVTPKILGWGSHGTIVFEGSLQGRAVAVKRLQQEFVTVASREVALLQESDDHPNVVRYFYQERKDNFLYIALELCPASLADIIERPANHKEIQAVFDPKKALEQITSGLRHLHSLKIVHRDIKPQNILVSKQQRNGNHRMMISDFGLCKKLEVDQTSFLPTTVMGGSVGWRAPEILRGDVKLDEASVAEGGSGSSNPPTIGPSTNGSQPTTQTRLTKSVDIFALGCLFYYALTAGEHPFGDKFSREVNILRDAVDLQGLEVMGEEGVEAIDLIRKMLAQDPQARPDTSSCLSHPYFWTPGRRLAFLQDASDRFEIMQREPPEAGLIALERDAIKVVGPDWHRRLDKVFIENLGKYRKYNGASVQDLLRALRNKKHHYQDLPDNVKRHLGVFPDGFLSYFTHRFPGLFLHVHSVVGRLPLRYESMFRSYFVLEDHP